MDSKKTSPKVLLFPFPAQGHLNPFLELARNLTKHNFVVYFCSTPVNLKICEGKLFEYSVMPVEFHLESTPELPAHHHTTNGLPLHLYFPLIDALYKSGPTFSNILKSIQPDLVIHDINQTFIPHIPSLYDIPSIYYQVFGAATQSYNLQPVKRPDLEFPSTAFFYRQYEIDLCEGSKPPDEYKHIDEDKSRLSCVEQSNEIILVRSSRAIEGKYIDFQSVLVEKKVVPLGSMVSEPKDDQHDDSEIIQWLNGKEEASTVYVCFGSQIFLTEDYLKEIALGLEMSNVNFIWVVRRSPHGEKTRLEQVLPEGFLDRTKTKGFVEEVWAPQTRILKHPSVGAFLSHCGWGSVVESISFGVPIIAMPMQYDQPLNARLVAELGVGLEVVGDETGLRKREEIARIIDEVMVKDAGEAIKRKSRELGHKMRVEYQEEIDVAVQLLRGICEKKHNLS